MVTRVLLLLLIGMARLAIIWEAVTKPVTEAETADAEANITAALAKFERTASGIVIGRHRPSYLELGIG